jgi:pyruvate/oxaloacetate carboxyltransferase
MRVIASEGTGSRMTSTMVQAPLKERKTDAQEARSAFIKSYDQIRDEVLADPMLAQKDARAWMSRMLDYNVPGGKLNRGMSVKDTLMTVLTTASEEQQRQADLVGWAIEFLQVQHPSLLNTRRCVRI